MAQLAFHIQSGAMVSSHAGSISHAAIMDRPATVANHPHAVDARLAMTGGLEFVDPDIPLPRLTVPGTRAVLMEDGLAAAPELAPPEVQEAIWAANDLQDKPYRYGGGHQRFEDTGYDCSGTVSFALNAAGLLDSFGCADLIHSPHGEWLVLEVGTDGLTSHVDRDLGIPELEREVRRRVAEAFWACSREKPWGGPWRPRSEAG